MISESPRTRLVLQPVQPPLHEPDPPALHGRLVDAQVHRGLPVRPALRAAQHDLGPQREVLRGLRTPGPARQLVRIGVAEDQVGLRTTDTARILQAGQSVGRELTTPLAYRLGLDVNKPRLLCCGTWGTGRKC